MNVLNQIYNILKPILIKLFPSLRPVIDTRSVIDILKSIVIEHGGTWKKEFNIIGFRNAENPGKWNDWIVITYKDKSYKLLSTVDPSVFYTNKPLNSKGAAHLCIGYHSNIWQWGKHRGKYKALVCRTKSAKVWRDLNQDYLDNDGIVEKITSINLHHGYNARERIGRNSAGCQVVRDIEPFKFLILLAEQSGYKRFSYTLVNLQGYNDLLNRITWANDIWLRENNYV